MLFTFRPFWFADTTAAQHWPAPDCVFILNMSYIFVTIASLVYSWLKHYQLTPTGSCAHAVGKHKFRYVCANITFNQLLTVVDKIIVNLFSRRPTILELGLQQRACIPNLIRNFQIHEWSTSFNNEYRRTLKSPINSRTLCNVYVKRGTLCLQFHTFLYFSNKRSCSEPPLRLLAAISIYDIIPRRAYVSLHALNGRDWDVCSRCRSAEWSRIMAFEYKLSWSHRRGHRGGRHYCETLAH